MTVLVGPGAATFNRPGSEDQQRRLTILHVLAPARVGGLEQVVHALATGHQEAGHTVHVAVVVSEEEFGHPFVSALRSAGIAVHVAVISARQYARERAFVRELCQRLRPDVMHTHGYRPDVVDSGVAIVLNIATISTIHGFIGDTIRGRFYEWLQQRWLRRLDGVVAVSRPQVELLKRAGVRHDRVHHIPNAWCGGTEHMSRSHARALLQISAAAFHVGWVGRLSSEKGADVLLAALRHLKDVPLLVSFIGEGPERASLSTRASITKETRVRWHGFVSNAASVYRAFDVFVMSSRTEGTPIALLEAMAAQVPIVTTAVGGVPDVVTEREALLVPSEDPSALAAAIRQVYEKPAEAAARVSAAAARLARHYAREPWLMAYERLYRSVCQSRNGS